MPAPRDLLPGRDVGGGWAGEAVVSGREPGRQHVAVRGIRGAVTCSENTAEAILSATSEMLETMVSRNSLSEKDIAAILFTVTPDLDAAFPARAARELGLASVALMCCTEIPVRDSLERCIRALALVNWHDGKGEVSHVYLGDAALLRPDIAAPQAASSPMQVETGPPPGPAGPPPGSLEPPPARPEPGPLAFRGMEPRPRPEVDRVPPYEAGLSMEEVASRYGLARVIKLASNENPLGPSPKAVKAACAAAARAHLYPDASAEPLRAAIAERFGLDIGQVVAGAGSDELIRLTVSAYAPPGSRVLIPRHTFSQYKIATILGGASPVELDLRPDMTADLDSIADAATAGCAPMRPTTGPPVSVVFICNPNNPTGTAVDAASIARLLERLRPAAGVLVVVDEAYVEFADEPERLSCVRLIADHPNLVVLRTFSKAYGLAGMRVGYSLSSRPVAESLLRIKPPFTVSYVALQAALAALKDDEHVERTLANNRAGKSYVARELAALGLGVLRTQANFMLVRLGRRCGDACEKLLAQGIIVRHTASFGLPEHVRVTVGTPSENKRLLDALYELAGEGVVESGMQREPGPGSSSSRVRSHPEVVSDDRSHGAARPGGACRRGGAEASEPRF